jgi:uncharacterized protein (TIGR02266 family)
MENISEGGAFVRTGMPLALGARALLRFALDGSAIEIAGKVVWRREPVRGDDGISGMGLRFEEGEAGMIRRIRDYVAKAGG